MKIITTKVHGIIDYLASIFLIATPWIYFLDQAEVEGLIFILMGVLAFIYNSFTDYELGVIRIIPFKIHLLLDLISGILLATSPWLFGFSEQTFLPHIVLGLIQIGTVVITQTKPWAERAAWY